MSDDKLDWMEREVHERLAQLRSQYEWDAAPYLKILADIARIRPKVFYVDGKTMIPLSPPLDKSTEGGGG